MTVSTWDSLPTEKKVDDRSEYLASDLALKLKPIGIAGQSFIRPTSDKGGCQLINANEYSD
jgi:hypothetical protein